MARDEHEDFWMPSGPFITGGDYAQFAVTSYHAAQRYDRAVGDGLSISRHLDRLDSKLRDTGRGNYEALNRVSRRNPPRNRQREFLDQVRQVELGWEP